MGEFTEPYRDTRIDNQARPGGLGKEGFPERAPYRLVFNWEREISQIHKDGKAIASRENSMHGGWRGGVEEKVGHFHYCTWFSMAGD